MRKNRKQKTHLGEENHERWLVSYADFITLLFAFFVVMYSISSVNEGKYRVLSETLGEVFGPERVATGGRPMEQPGALPREIVSLPEEFPLRNSLSEDSASEDSVEQSIREQALRAMQLAASQQRVFDELTISLDTYVQRDLIELRLEDDRIEVDMKARMLFPSGAANLSDEALKALRQVAQSLLPIPNPIQVEGHTDNVPISNFIYRSNWELSAARAASVVQYLEGLGVAPARLAALGMGEHRPIADNETSTGRARNRRVTLMILGAEPEVFAPEQIVPWAEGPAVGN